MDVIILQYIDAYYLHIMVLIGITSYWLWGVNITTGVTGQLSMGHAGFMSIGAYVSAIMTLQMGLAFPVALLLGASCCCVFRV